MKRALWSLLWSLLAMLALATPAQAQSGGSTFDHNTTGFPLVGAHELVRCETCHIKGIFKGTPRDCAICHAQNNERGAKAKPANHIQTLDSCDTCHSIAAFSGARYNHVMALPGSCAQCHDNVRAPGKPSGHIPTTQSCDVCHGVSAFLPVKKFDHSTLAGNWTTCQTCHDGRQATGKPASHIPTPNGGLCGTCHIASTLNGFTTFAGGQMDHTGIVSKCADCHGPSVTSNSFFGITSIVTMPATSPAGANAHIPSSTTCESCHLANVPGGLVPANAAHGPPGTVFASPAPSGLQIHAGITSGCSSCHEAGQVWLGMNAYPISPTTLIADASYNGFQTRPRAAAGTFNIADAQHPSAGDCSQCHFSTAAFTGKDKPANHIPTAPTAQCTACHTSTDFSVMPTLTNIHANAPSSSSNCAQCHGASVVAGFAIPAANFSIVGPPGNHVPTNASCETCHVGAGSSIAATPVVDGAKFSGSLMSHSGIASNCAACHGPGITGSSFAGVSRIVTMPATSPMGANSHIPSSTACESCHLASTPSGLIAASATKSAPGTAFATPAPTTAQIHAGVTSGCSSCHDSSYVWMGMSAYPIAPTTLTSGAQYTGFQTRPRAAAGTFNVADAQHPGSGDCSQCHGGTNFFSAQDRPANHIPISASAQCSSCHTSTDFSVMPTLANIHANAPSTTGNCSQCHGASVVAGFAIPGANFSIVGPPSNHVPTNASCELCHVGAGSSIAATPVPDGAKFSGSLMSHSGITSNCAACHGPSITGSSFAGISRIVAIPPTSPMGANSHIPSAAACESCHLATVPSGQIAANASKSAPGTAFATPAPTTAQIHSGVTSGCSSCHDSNYVWMGMSAYPIAPTTLTPNGQYTGFQTRPRSAAGTFNVADSAHPTSGDCSQCHSGTNFFTAQDKPANHIPTAAAAQCSACHTTGDFSAMPTLANIHANAPSTTNNCSQCHAASVVAGFAIPAANFSIVGPPANHLPTTASCEQCHVGAGSSITATPVPNGAKFSGSLMSHSGIATNCASCHGPSVTGSSFAGITRIVVMPGTTPVGPTSHIPSSTTCETCHVATTPAGLIAANATKTAPGTAFATPAPTTAQIHSGITSGCASCHESSYVWMGMSAYPIAPTTLTSGAQYTGFQTRPRSAAGTFNIADVAHPSTGDCSQCHSGTNFFSAQDKPANHIPTATNAQCAACHTSSDFSVMPTLTAIHANAPSTTNNCSQCHGASVVAGFAIPAANFSIVGPPGNHVPTSASCELCHVGAGSSIAATPVVNGAKFSGSLMSHSGITNNCVTCHGPSVTGSSFAGISRIVVLPPTSPAGATSHIPSSTTCESCHLATTPAGLIAANATKTAPGTAFATPAPTTAQIHSGITSGCASCHEAAFVWMGMSAYPIAPTTLTSGAQYTGFQTRPRAAAGTFNIADAAHPSTGDCSQCHSGTNFFTATDKPANHIPTAAAAQCNACHTSTDFSVMPTLAAIHANAPSTSSNCSQCHAASVVAGFAIPAANFSIVGPPGNHVPTNASCELCHVGSGSSIAATPVPNGAKFSGSLMSHSGITNNCVACHGPSITGSSFAGITKIVALPPTSPVGATSHIPSSTTCESCHLATTPAGLIAANATKTAPGTAFATPAPTTAQIHSGITSGCASCHEAAFVWMGMSAYPIAPTTLTSGAQYTGFQTRPRAAAGTFNIADAAHPSTGDCSQCHSGTNFFTATDKPANHIPTSATAQCTACHTSTDFSVMPTLANIHANAPSTTSNCSQCHAASVVAGFAIPSANFTIVGPPSNHVPTSASCELCHVGAGSSITATPVPNGAKFSGSLMSHSGITNNCVACHGPSITGSSFAGITKIVALPPTSPVGVTSHIPSSTTCESCHLATTPSGLIAANATKTAPGTAFATPAPTTAQIHAGITSGCTSCHEANFVWMGMTAYPIAPTTLTSGAQYTGFNTRPRSAAGTFNVADAAHPSTGDCVQCHNGTNYFSATDKPANHIPTATSAQCTACHTNPDFSVLPTLANIHANAPSTTSNCAQCHAASVVAGFAIPSANFTIVGPPGNHIPTSAACELCHVGAGSSVSATPVPNGAKFSGSLMNHSGITSNCVACHGPGITGSSFSGITKIVAMPPTSPVGASSHIPSSTTCESCHLAAVPAGMIAANATKTAPGTAFATPAPTTAQIHAGITSGCSSCHDTSFVWMGMSAYPISPTTVVASAQYTGFHSRPTAAGGTFAVVDAAHPTTGDCSQCHSGTNFFSAQAKPAGHIPTSQPCTTCHVTAGDFSVAGLTTNLTTLHTGISSGCISCHSAGTGAGPFAGCTTQATCPATPPLTYQPKTTPLAAGGSPTAPSSQTHVPVVGISCEKCHSPTVFTSFAGMQMKGNTNAHTAVAAATCESCHEYRYTWYGVTITTPGSVNHNGRTAGEDCISSGCHRKSYSSFSILARVKPVQRSALAGGPAMRVLPDDAAAAGADAGASPAFNHQGVLPGQCATCHNGRAARGLPAKHLMTRASCDSCHRTTAWVPAQFSHLGSMQGQCNTCHNGASATGKPAGHFVTVRSCDSCHRTVGWTPVLYSHLSPAYHPMPDKSTCVSCHITNGEIIPRQLRGGPRPKPTPG